MNEAFGTPTGGATIEFRCHQCGKLLRSGGSFAGKQSKCPNCGTMVNIPDPNAPDQVASAAPPGGSSGGTDHGLANQGLDSQGSAGIGPGPMAAGSPGAGTASSPPSPGAMPGSVQGGMPGQPPAGTSPPSGYGQQLPPGPGRWANPVNPPATGTYPSTGYQPAGPPPVPTSGSGGYGVAGSGTAGYGAGAAAAGPPPRQDRLPKISVESAGGGRATPLRNVFERIMTQVRKIYVGQDELVLGSLVALFSSGHVLIESFPGLGKTLFVRTLGQVLGCKFGRIQFTADLMPSDITGSPLFDMKTQEFRFRPGPVFTQLLLADEINRSPAKAHAALLEIMQERNVTVDGLTHKLERPFLVMATQNPIESEGTYNLPEAQLDRFMFKLIADYPQEQEEAAILRMHSQQVDVERRFREELETVTSPEEIVSLTEECGKVRVDDKLVDYINKLVRLTRQWPQFYMGASPRAGITLMQGARTLAAFRGRDYAVPDDVVELALPALRHRVVLTAEAEVEGREVDEVLTQMIRTLEVPRL